MTPRHAAAASAHAISTASGRGQPVAGIPHRLDRVRVPELLPKAADAHVDDVRAGVEAVAPDLREEPFAAHDLAWVGHEVEEQPELAVREVDQAILDACLSPRDVELHHAGADGRAVVGLRTAQVDADARDKLVERERLHE